MNKECKFCNYDENGDYSDDRKPLLDDILGVSLKKTFADEGNKIMLDCNRELGVSLFVDGLGLSFLIDDISSGKEIYVARIPAKFCPKCGRKL